MNSVQTVRLVDSIPIHGAENVPGSNPRQIRLHGDDFRSVDRVILNGIETQDFVVESPRVLRVVVPPSLQSARIQSIAVISNRVTLSERSVIQLGMGPKPKAVSGVLRLLQVFVRHLFRTPRSNIFYPESGGGVRELLRGRVTDVNRVTADLTVAIDRVQRFIVRAQSQVTGLPLDERLLSARLTNVHQVDDTTIEASIVITSHSGRSAMASFMAG